VKAFLLAAGLGTRFRPATDLAPKPLLWLANEPIIDRRLRSLAEAGIGEVAVNGHHLADELAKHLGDGSRFGLKLSFFREEPAILGTAGALANARVFLGQDDFLLWNSDAEIQPDIALLQQTHLRSGAATTLLVRANPDPARYTPLYGEGVDLRSIGGDGVAPLLFTGVSILSPRALARIGSGPRSLVEDLWRPLLEERSERIALLLHTGPFFDIAGPADLLAASQSLLARGGPFGPATSLFLRERRVLTAASLPRDAEIEESVIGPVPIPADTRLRQCVVWPEAVLEAGVEATSCLIGRGRVPAGRYHGAFLWNGAGGSLAALPLRR
jgi:mannose-1-phosphate guanylyltransferase